MHSFLEHLTEAYNKGQEYERQLIGELHSKKLGKVGVLSGRGNDAFVHLANGKTYKMGIKADDAAAGQVQFGKGKSGWEYQTKEKQGQPLVNTLHSLGAHGSLEHHYGSTKAKTKQDQVDHVRSIHKTKGELHVPVIGNSHQLSKVLYHGMNKDHLVHIKGKGTYAMTPKIAKETGIDFIGDRLNSDEDPVSIRHRVKTHSSAKNGKPAVRSLTAQINLNTSSLEDSDHSIVLHGLKRKEDV
jgi:hypothetical protein